MTIIVLDDLLIIFGAFVILIIAVIRSRNQKYRILSGAWLVAFGVLEAIYCAFIGVSWILWVSGVFPSANSGWKFIPDYFGLTVAFPVLLSIGIVSVAYGLHVSNPKNPTPQKNVFFGTANPQTSNAQTIPQPNPPKIYCYFCGAENPYENNFCSKCGQKLVKNVNQQTNPLG